MSSIDDERDIITELIREGECVMMKCPDGLEMEVFYMHDSIIDVIGVMIYFTLFECEVLLVVNVAPSQFHPTSWTFARSIKIVCQGLNINSTIEVFFIVQKW